MFGISDDFLCTKSVICHDSLNIYKNKVSAYIPVNIDLKNEG